jgi:hypothetical protein
MEGYAMRELRRTLWALLLIALASCASDVAIETSYDPLAVFPSQGTFAWDEDANKISDKLSQLGLADLLPPAVESALGDRGWRKTTPDTAHLLVSYHVGVSITIWAAEPGDDEHSRAMGSISVELTDPESKRRLWVGFIQAEVHPSLSQQERTARIDDAMERLFKEFPP